MNSPRVYVASLADYNAGRLHGAWVDLDGETVEENAEVLSAGISEMLARSPESTLCSWCGVPCRRITAGRFSGWTVHVSDVPRPSRRRHVAEPGIAEEYAIHDHEGFEGATIGEYSSVTSVAGLAAGLNEHGPAWLAFVAYVGADDATPEAFEEAYRGEYPSIGDYAEELAADIGDVPPDRWPFYLIDWDRAGRELEMAGDVWTVDASGGVYVFSG